MATKKNINIKRIHTDRETAFRYWLEFLKPYHKLRHKEIEALAIMLYYRYKLSLDIDNPEFVNRILFSTETRVKIREQLNNMSSKVFNNLLTSLRKKKVLTKNNEINPILIPKMNEEGFTLMFDFDIKKN